VCGTSKKGVMSLRGLGPRAVHGGHEKPRLLRGRLEERVAREARADELRDRRNEPLAVAQGEDIHERHERRGVHPRDVSADEKHGMPLVALLSSRGDARRAERLHDVDDVHLPRQGPGEQAEVGEGRARFEGHGRLSFVEEKPLAGEVGNLVEQPVDPLKAEVGHADFVGVGEPQGDPVGAEPISGFGEALQGRALTVLGSRFHGEPSIIAVPSSLQ
jgi:hypothetical protein